MALPDIASLIRARASLLWIATTEEARVERYIFETLQPFGYEVLIWDCADGVVDHTGKEAPPGKTAVNPDKVLQTIQASALVGAQDGQMRLVVWIMRDLHRWLSSPVTVRRLRSVAKAIRASLQTIVVIVPPSAELPADLKNEVVVVEWSLPDREEVGALLDASAERVAISKDVRAPAVASAIRESVRNGRREQLVDAALGMSGEQAAAAFALSLVATKVLDRDSVLREKKRVVAAVSGLSWTDADPRGLDAVGGNEGLKDWLKQRRSAFGPKAREFGLPAPRGVLLLGPPGTGKSLSAKAVSSAWGVPLLRLDLGSAKSKYVGESEGNIRQALKVAATVAPCVLWVDEIEKALGGSTGPQGDGGVASDALGTLLTFLQENDAGCFLLACLTGDAEVVRADGSVCRLDSLAVRDSVCAWNEEAGAIVTREIDLVVSPVARHARRVRTKTAAFTASLNHPVFVVGDDGIEPRPVAALLVGDRLMRPRKLPEPTSDLVSLENVEVRNCHEQLPVLPEQLTEELAEMLGALTADGTFQTGGRVSLTDKDPQLVAHWTQLMAVCFGRAATHKVKGRNSMVVYVSSRPTWRWLAANFPEMVASKQTRGVPAAIFRSPDRVVAAFLRGFLDGDGTVSQTQVVVGGANWHLIKNVEHLLHRLGVAYTVNTYEPKGSRRPVRRLSIASRETQHNDMLSFSSAAKQARLLACASRRQGAAKAAALDTCPVPQRLMEQLSALPGMPRHAFIYYARCRSKQRWLVSHAVIAQWATVAEQGHAPAAYVEALRKIARVTWDEIVEIEQVEGPVQVYDIRVPEEHTYIGNGLVMHNTANDVTTLPPELLRKGRFDQMFFLDLPDAIDRVDIFKVCLARRKQGLAPSPAMINATDGFSGAELQAVVDDGLFTAFADGCRALTEADVLTAVASTVPLSRSAAEKLSALREWAKGRCRPAGRIRTEDAGSRFSSINMD